MSGTELAIVLVLALLLLGPAKLPELARTMGKAVRDFKRATNDIRGSVESEFYRMDQPEPPAPKEPLPQIARPEGSVPADALAAPAPAAAPLPVGVAAPAAEAPTDPAAPPPAAKPIHVAEVVMRAASPQDAPSAPVPEPSAPSGAKS